jgi:hypothetical protein
MAERANPADLVDRAADERLLGADMPNLPEWERRPQPPAPRRARSVLVAAGATLTGVTLVGGIALLAFGAIDAIASGLAAADVAAIAVGAVLVATHWGWIHVAELARNALDARRTRGVRSARQGWLDAIKPYTRYSVATSVLDDGSIKITRIRHLPVAAAERTFTFARAVDLEEVHSGDEPAAEVSDRAEALRRDAALATERERRRWAVAADAYERAALGRDDEQQRLIARRAASEALSDQINANLREPPLIE